MKILFGFGVFALLLVGGPIHADLVVQPNDVVAVCDDSFPWVRLSSVYVADYLLMCQPVAGVRVMQLGWNRESIGVFMGRLENDLSPFQPAVVVTSLGTDDGENGPLTPIGIANHTKDRARTIDGLKKIGVRAVVLASTGCVDPSTGPGGPDAVAAWNKNLGALRDADRQVAATASAMFADPLQAMLEAMPKAKAMYGDKYSFNFGDGIHQNTNGQLIKAYAFLKALGCDGAIGAITIDLGANTAEGTPGQKIVSVNAGSVEVESTRYPFCFQGSPERPGSTAGVIQFFPFNDDLNRYLLVVKGLSGTKGKVTWGNQSREFSTDALAKGVNLAAAFAAHTPFDSQFLKVEAAISEQQSPQVAYLQYFFHNLAEYKAMVGAHTAPVDQLAAAIIKQDKDRAAAAAALVVPVRYTLKIENLP